MDVPALYHRLILWIGDGTGLPDAILHIHAGMAVLMLARVATGRSLATMLPFAFTLAAELANELLDYLHYGLRPADTLADLGNTLFWPLVVSLGVRWRPMIRRDRRALGRGETRA